MRRQDLLDGHAGSEPRRIGSTVILVPRITGLPEHDGRIEGDAPCAGGVAGAGVHQSARASQRGKAGGEASGCPEIEARLTLPSPAARERGFRAARRTRRCARTQRNSPGWVRGTGAPPGGEAYARSASCSTCTGTRASSISLGTTCQKRPSSRSNSRRMRSASGLWVAAWCSVTRVRSWSIPVGHLEALADHHLGVDALGELGSGSQT